MDTVLASSRGKGMGSELSKILPDYPGIITELRSDRLHQIQHNLGNINIIRKKGGKLSELAALVPSIIWRTQSPARRQHVYFLAGLCDLTFRDMDDQFYEEVIFMESPMEAYARMTTLYESVSESVINNGAIPCFSTIPPSNLNTWNEVRLNDHHATSYLLHFHQYDDMQGNLIQAIEQINKFIVKLNSRNGMSTPFLASTIMDNVPGGAPRVHYNRLRDGVHATDITRKKWAQKLKNAITRNRQPQIQKPLTPLTIPDPDTDSDDPDFSRLRDELNRSLEAHLETIPIPNIDDIPDDF